MFPGWGAVGLCAAAAAAALGLRSTERSRAALAAAWAVAAAMIAAGPLFFLDVIGGILAGIGLPVSAPSILGRGGMVARAALLAVAALAYRRRLRGACARCGRRGHHLRPEGVPAWAFAGAYAAVTGCLVRLAAQYGFAGLDGVPRNGGAALVVFEIGFLLAGTLLPLALVHRWGLIWPRRVLGPAGRRIPRWLVLGPAVFIAGGMIAYFGFQQVEMVADLVTGAPTDTDGVPGGLAFLWVSIPAYTVWGLGAATAARLRQTSPACGRCGV